jgi:hypothetical protein
VGKFDDFGISVADTFKRRREHISERAGGSRRGGAHSLLARFHDNADIFRRCRRSM